MPKHSTRQAAADAAYDDALSDLIHQESVAETDHDNAELKHRDALTDLASIEADFAAGSNQYELADYPLALAAVRATELRLAATSKARDAAARRVRGRDLSTYVADALVPHVTDRFPGVEILTTANPVVEVPTDAERPLIVLSQPGPSKAEPSGLVVAQVDLHMFAPTYQSGRLDRSAAVDLLEPGTPSTTVRVEFASQGEGVDILRMDVSTAPDTLPVYSEVGSVKFPHMGTLLEREYARDLPQHPFRAGVPLHIAEAIAEGRPRFSVASTTGSERIEGDRRVTTLTSRVHSSLDLDEVDAIAQRAKGAFLPYVGFVERVRTARDAGSDGTGRYLVVSEIVSQVATTDTDTDSEEEAA